MGGRGSPGLSQGCLANRSLRKQTGQKEGPFQIPVAPPWKKASHSSVLGKSADAGWFGAE